MVVVSSNYSGRSLGWFLETYLSNSFPSGDGFGQIFQTFFTDEEVYVSLIPVFLVFTSPFVP